MSSSNSRSKTIWLVAALIASLGCADFERGPRTEAVVTTPREVTSETEIDFATVHAVLMARCAGCHDASSGTALHLTGDVTADYTTVQALVNLAEPAASALIRKGSGREAHAGGEALAGNDLDIVLGWIEAGAPATTQPQGEAP